MKIYHLQRCTCSAQLNFQIITTSEGYQLWSFSLSNSHSIPFKTKYSHHHPLLKSHQQSVIFLWDTESSFTPLKNDRCLQIYINVEHLHTKFQVPPQRHLFRNKSYIMYIHIYIFSPLWRCGPTPAMASSCLRFLYHTQRRTTVGRTPLDTWSARRRDLCLTTHDTHNRQTSMPPVGFEPTSSAGERPWTYTLDRAATRTGIHTYIHTYKAAGPT